jgi:hypothetical protein
MYVCMYNMPQVHSRLIMTAGGAALGMLPSGPGTSCCLDAERPLLPSEVKEDGPPRDEDEPEAWLWSSLLTRLISWSKSLSLRGGTRREMRGCLILGMAPHAMVRLVDFLESQRGDDGARLEEGIGRMRRRTGGRRCGEEVGTE